MAIEFFFSFRPSIKVNDVVWRTKETWSERDKLVTLSVPDEERLTYILFVCSQNCTTLEGLELGWSGVTCHDYSQSDALYVGLMLSLRGCIALCACKYSDNINNHVIRKTHVKICDI